MPASLDRRRARRRRGRRRPARGPGRRRRGRTRRARSPSSWLWSAGPQFSQSMTHTPPSAVGRTLSAHRSRWQVRIASGGSSQRLRGRPARRADSASRPANGAPAAAELRDQLVPAGRPDRVDGTTGPAARGRSTGTWWIAATTCPDHAPGQGPGRAAAGRPTRRAGTWPPPIVGEHGPSVGPPHLRRRHAGGVGGLLERAPTAPPRARRTGTKGTLTAQRRSTVSQRQTSPCFPRATGPFESAAGPSNPNQRAISTGFTRLLGARGRLRTGRAAGFRAWRARRTRISNRARRRRP